MQVYATENKSRFQNATDVQICKDNINVYLVKSCQKTLV